MLTLTLQILISIGVAQALILAVVLLVVPQKRPRASICLALVLLVSSLILSTELADLLNVNFDFGRGLAIVLDLLIGPLILGVLFFSIDKDRQWVATDFIHLLPLALALIWLTTGFQRFGQDTSLFQTTINDAIALFVFYKIMVLLTYVVLYFRKLKTTSSLKKDLKRFLQFLGLGFGIIILVGYGMFVLMFLGVQFTIDSDFLASIAVTAFVYGLTYWLIRYPNLFFSRQGSSDKYANSHLDPQMSEDLQQKLLAYLDSEKPYLNQKLSLVQVATHLGTSSNALSQVINGSMGKTFNDLINEYRLKEVKYKLLDPQEGHKKILALAYESGFQSKASFNRIFKKHEGVSPQDFKRINRSHPTQ